MACGQCNECSSQEEGYSEETPWETEVDDPLRQKSRGREANEGIGREEGILKWRVM